MTTELINVVLFYKLIFLFIITKKKRKMLYVLCRIIPYESHEIMGVFDNRDLAVKTFHLYTKQEEVTFHDDKVEYDRVVYQIETYVLNTCDWLR